MWIAGIRSVVLHNFNKVSARSRRFSSGFTMLEVIVAIALAGIGITSTVAALTKLNAFAGASRNATGAYSLVMNQIELFQSLGPFNPLTGTIPEDPSAFPKYDMTLGTHKISTNGTDWDVPVYADSVTPTIVPGILTVTVADASGGGPPVYSATVTVAWQYLGRGPVWSPERDRWEYQFTMSTLRASDL